MANDKQAHRLAAYFSSDGEKYLPVMDCTCGFDTGRCANFSDAGMLIDDHLDEVRQIEEDTADD